MADHNLVARSIGVKELKTTALKQNPHNPRVLFDEIDLRVLRDSIKRVGILVPLTVYREKRSGDYVILDGARRWRCASEIGLDSVPVNEVAEPDVIQNIITMFQIHKLRKDWELMPTALKMELLMLKLEDRNSKRLAELTGLDEAVVTRCKKLLSYGKNYQDMMLSIDPQQRLKADFFIELYPIRTDREVNKFEWFKKDPFTDAMLEKQEVKGIKAVTDFRVVKQHISNAVRDGKISLLSKRLREFQDKPALPPTHLDIESAQFSAEARKLKSAADRLYEQLDELDVDQYYGEGAMWDSFEGLSQLIRKKLQTMGRRLKA